MMARRQGLLLAACIARFVKRLLLSRYQVPGISLATMQAVVKILRATRAHPRDLFALPVDNAQVSNLLQAANVLQIPALFILCVARTFLRYAATRCFQ